MCTMIIRQVEVEGRSKAAGGWFTVRQANVSYDHPFSLPLEHALNIDFVDEAQGPGARVAVELTVESARTLVEAIQTVLARAEAGGYLEEDRAHSARHVTPRATGQPAVRREQIISGETRQCSGDARYWHPALLGTGPAPEASG